MSIDDTSKKTLIDDNTFTQNDNDTITVALWTFF